MGKTKIDWADRTWNPVTGCRHGCEYCYARRIAERFGNRYMPFGNDVNVLEERVDGENGVDPYPFGFEPTFHRYRLDEPKRIKKPQTIFVCSMADLFGDWVPDEWIKAVFKACEDAPQHRYLFLTKNPNRYNEIHVPVFTTDSFMGASATTQKQADSVSKAVADMSVIMSVMMRAFISIEPILEPIVLRYPEFYHWVIVGSETGNRKGKIVPEKAWIDTIVTQCRQWSVPIFMKESLRHLMDIDFVQEFPWEVAK